MPGAFHTWPSFSSAPLILPNTIPPQSHIVSPTRPKTCRQQNSIPSGNCMLKEAARTAMMPTLCYDRRPSKLPWHGYRRKELLRYPHPVPSPPRPAFPIATPILSWPGCGQLVPRLCTSLLLPTTYGHARVQATAPCDGRFLPALAWVLYDPLRPHCTMLQVVLVTSRTRCRLARDPALHPVPASVPHLTPQGPSSLCSKEA